MTTINQLLPLVRANRYTFYNLDKKEMEMFRKKYNRLLTHKNRDVAEYGIFLFNREMKENEFSYLRKLNCINILLSWMK
jgi:hypothetical protein